jgi:hypothetical protein
MWSTSVRMAACYRHLDGIQNSESIRPQLNPAIARSSPARGRLQYRETELQSRTLKHALYKRRLFALTTVGY